MIVFISDGPCEVAAGAILTGRVMNKKANQGITVQLPDKYTGHVALTDIADEFQDIPTNQVEENDFVQCCVLACKKNKCELSMRNSR